ncbi:MAG: hypothetical protein HOV97_34755, partial [Nonomuraea sp.]|nr:hypothetical protein [Nonomuraea sp.]
MTDPDPAAAAFAGGARLWRTAAGLALACHPGPTVAVTARVTALAVAAGRD